MNPSSWPDKYAVGSGSLYESESRGDFHVGQNYTDAPCKTYFCLGCGSDKFLVGDDDYCTAIKCPSCGWECVIHNG